MPKCSKLLYGIPHVMFMLELFLFHILFIVLSNMIGYSKRFNYIMIRHVKIFLRHMIALLCIELIAMSSSNARVTTPQTPSGNILLWEENCLGHNYMGPL